MLKKWINKLLKRYGLWRLVHVFLITVTTILACIFVIELVIPVRLGSNNFAASINTKLITEKDLSDVLQSNKATPQDLAKLFRSDLFKAATVLKDKPMADRTIERIKSQLKLQCIMEINGKQVAYVNISGIGLKKCCVGDLVNDLFTVLNINKNGIDVTIVGHRTTLSL